MLYDAEQRRKSTSTSDGVFNIQHRWREVRRFDRRGIGAHSEEVRADEARRPNRHIAKSKKKIDEELQAYFPNTDSNIERAEQLHLVKKRLLLMLNEIIEDTSKEKEIKEIDQELQSRERTTDYGRFEVESDKSFETSCLLIGQEMHKDAKSMTVMEYETSLEILRKRQEEWEKRKRR